jgi:hypothetical protein
VTQHSRLEIAAATVGIDQAAVGGLCDCIDREVAAPQVLGERHLGSKADFEAAIARRDFAFEAGERVFLVALRMQKHREVAPDLSIVEPQHFLARAADHDPIAFLDGQSQQAVPNRAANQIHLHR